MEPLFKGRQHKWFIILLLILVILAPGVAAFSAAPQEKIQDERGLGVRPQSAKPPAAKQGASGTGGPELVLQTGLTSPAGLVAFSPDGRLLASMSAEGSAVKLWELATGRELRSFDLGTRTLLSSSVTGSFNFSPDGRLLTAHSANRIKTWEVETGREMPDVGLPANEAPISSAFSLSGSVLATKSTDSKSVKLWDAATGRELRALTFSSKDNGYEPVLAVAVSPDGSLVATLRAIDKDSSRGITRQMELTLWSAGGDKVRAFDVPDVKMMGMGETLMENRGLAFSPDGRWLAMSVRDQHINYAGALGAAPTKIADRQENKLVVYETASGREIRAVNFADPAGDKVSGPWPLTGDRTFAFSPDAKVIAVACNDGTVKQIDVATGNRLQTITSNDTFTACITFSRDGRTIAASSIDSTIKLWEAATGRALRTLSGNAMAVENLAFSADGRSLVAGGHRTVNVWELQTGGVRRALTLPDDHSRQVLSIDRGERPERFFSADGRFLASTGSGNASVKIWDVTTGREARSLPAPAGKRYASGAFSPDGRLVALAERRQAGGAQDVMSQVMEDDTLTRMQENMRDPAKQKDQMKRMQKLGKDPRMKQIQKEIEEASKTGDFTKAMELSQEMMKLMSGPEPAPTGPTAGAAKPRSGITLIDAATGRELHTLPLDGLLTPAHYKTQLAFSPDGRALATATGISAIKLWDVESGRELRALRAERNMEVQQIAWSANGRLLASAHWQIAAGLNVQQMTFSLDAYVHSVKIWNAETGSELHNLPGHTNFISALAFSRDGRFLASGGQDNTVKLWDCATGRELRTLYGHSSSVTALDFSPDGRLLVSGGDDGSARVWDAQSGALLATLVSLNKGDDWLVISPDGLFDGSPAGWQQILWRFSQSTFDVSPVEIFFNEFYYPGLLADILAGKKVRAAVDISQKDRRQPQLRIELAQPQGGSVASREVPVKVTVTQAPAGAQDVRLFRNGSLVKAWRGDVLKGQSAATLETTIPIVAGENRLTAYGFNRDNVKSADAALIVTGAESLKRPGTAYVLAVGINQYANPEYDLKFGVPDAQTFGEELQKQQGRLSRYARVEVVPLFDKDATKANILLALKRLTGGSNEALPANAPSALAKLQPAQPEDAVVVYYAGHGTAQEQRFYLIPHDLGYTGARTELTEAGLKTMLAHSVSDLELEQAFEKIDAGQLLMVIDACNSGQALEAEEKRRGPMNSKGLAQLAYEKGMYILTAAQGYQAALEAEQLGHGYLTYALVEEGLKAAAADYTPADGVIVAREWLDYATERVPNMQTAKLKQARELKIKIAFVEGEEKIEDADKRSLQRPRVFYRREAEAEPLVVAKPGAK